jgi:hypothetical protein
MGKQTGPSMGVRGLFKGWQLGFKTLTAHQPSPPGAGAAPFSSGAGDLRRPGQSPHRAMPGEQPHLASRRAAPRVAGPRAHATAPRLRCCGGRAVAPPAGPSRARRPPRRACAAVAGEQPRRLPGRAARAGYRAAPMLLWRASSRAHRPRVREDDEAGSASAVIGRSCGRRPRPWRTWPWGKVVREPTDHSVVVWAQERRR